VLVVDDSALVRRTVQDLLARDPEIEVIATAPDAYVAADRIRKEAPDVILLDVEMPRMDGLTFLRRIMAQHPIPVVICSSLAESGMDTAMKALEYGAVDVIAKPRVATREFLEESLERLRAALLGAKNARLQRHIESLQVPPKLTADAVLPPRAPGAVLETTERVIVVGASTGGTEAIAELLRDLPPDSPGIVVVQHMPEKFTTAFADRLNSLCAISVKEAEDRDGVLRGHALIAPGNRHTLLERSGARYHVGVREGPMVCRHRPSVDVLFRSAARAAGKNAVGVILTGMGDDGARGLLELRQSGAATFAQDEKTCVVFGMPKEAIALGGAGRVLPLNAIAGAMLLAAAEGRRV
jgi:two-component system chemotaxis response regulator CheB